MSDQAPAPDDPDSLIGETLANRYFVETRLGEGAMGAVYKARHVKVGRAFAVKVLHPRLLDEHKVAQRFEREAELAGRLRHPNVIGVVDVGETPTGLRYMVMDFAEGGDLADLLAQAPFPPPRIIHLVRQLLEGLYHAHEHGLIHRDFKPENVIVEKDMHGNEVPRIVDFGIAILREGGDAPDGGGRLTTNGLVLGTPHYMAPEQAVADPIDHRIDLFAMGIVIYEMLCGKLPFDGGGAEVARANLMLDPPPIAERVPYLEVDPLLEAFARRLMAKKRDHRPATAKAARELLDLIERDRPAAAAALGVPLDATPRLPVRTADSSPIRAPRDTDAPADTAKTPADVRDLQTAPAVPLPYREDAPAPARRPPWAILGAVGTAAAAGVVALILATRGGSDAPAKPPAPTPAPVAVAPVDPTPADPTPADPPPEPATSTSPPETPPETPPEAPETPPEVPAKPARPTTKPARPTTKPATKPAIATTPPPAPVSDAAKVARQYQMVGAKLKALGPGHDDLWTRWRLIKIQAVMADPSKLRTTAQTLTAIERDVAARKK